MARAYSIDLRERVIGAIQAGTSCHQAAAQFRVAVSTAVLWALEPPAVLPRRRSADTGRRGSEVSIATG